MIDNPFSMDTPSAGVRRLNRLPLYLITGAAIVGFLAVTAMVAADRAQHRTAREGRPKAEVLAGALARPPAPPPPAAERPELNPDGFCNGYEVFCSSTTTGQPVETLQKLAAAMPPSRGVAANYRILVSIVALPEPEPPELPVNGAEPLPPEPPAGQP